MELEQVIEGVEKMVSDAWGECNLGNTSEAKDILAEAAGLIQKEIGENVNEAQEEDSQEEVPKETGCEAEAHTEQAGS